MCSQDTRIVYVHCSIVDVDGYVRRKEREREAQVEVGDIKSP